VGRKLMFYSEEVTMRFRVTCIFVCALLVMTASALFAAGTTFTDVAIDPGSGIHFEDFSMGTAVMDFNNDGYDDIIIANYAYNLDRLFKSNGDGTFTEMADAAGVATPIKTLGIACADIDASGYIDFLVFTEYSYSGGSDEPGFLYLNNGNSTFTDAGIQEFSSAIHGYEGYNASFADIDGDGLLDVLYAGRMYHNLGNNQFVDWNVESGLTDLPFAVHAAFADIDNDCDPDLYLARQSGRVGSLYLNDGSGHFTDVSNWMSETAYGFSGSFADVDNDGDLDLFVSYCNKMFLNDGTGHFTRNYNANTTPRYSRGSVFADFDNDGDPDLVIANEDGSSTYHENQGNGTFIDKTAEVGMDNNQDKAGGVAVGDFDNDGALDMVIAKSDYRVNPVFINNLDNDYFIRVQPRGVATNFSGIGAKVYVYESGYLGDVSHQVGMGEATSTTGDEGGGGGYVHLGTGGPGTFDVRVVFSNCVTVDTLGVANGSRLDIYETGEAPNRIYAAPGNVNVAVDAEAEPVSEEISLTDYFGTGIAWTATSLDNWITLDINAGMTPATITATVDPSGFALGTYTGQIEIVAEDAVNSPLTIAVNLDITDYFLLNVGEDIGLTTPSFTFGAAFSDFNLDGYDDIFVNNSAGTSMLYQSDGTQFFNVASTAGVTGAFHNLGILGCDINADGLPDYVSFTEDQTVGFTYVNTGFGTFVDESISGFSTALGYDGFAVAGADIENDGDLDIFYGARLFRNDGNMTYVDITDQAGLSNIRFVTCATFGDIDNDGDMDLIAVRQNQKAALLFRNDGNGVFENISTNSNLGYFPTGLGASLGDIDNDGDLDMYITAGYSNANHMYENDGSGFFTDITYASGTSCNNYSRGSDLVDIDNDGDLDLIVCNENTTSQLFLNDGTGTFTDVTESSGMLVDKSKGTAAPAGDFDGDGDLDIYVGRTDYKGNTFLKNATDNNAYIDVTPVGVVSNKPAIGARAYLYPAGSLGDPEALFAFQEYNISNGISTSMPNRLHFGTGTGTLFDLRVVFPSGVVVDQTDVAPGSRLTVIESGEIPDYLVLVPGGFNFSFLEGDDPDQSTMQIKNSNGNPIAWTATVDDGWCTLNSYSGTTDETITVTVDPTGLNAGEYETMIRISAPDAFNSPRTAAVHMTITSNQPILSINKTTLNFVAEYQGFDPWDQGFTVSNTGQGTLNWELTIPEGAPLTVSPTFGVAPTNVSIQPHIAGLEIGLYTYTLTVAAERALNSPQIVTVNLQIIPGDVPEADTIRITSATVQPGQAFTVPVTIHNVTTLAGFTIPLVFDPAVLSCDSVSFAGSRVEYVNYTDWSADNEAGRILLGMVVFFEDPLPPGDGMVATMYMQVNGSAEDQVTTIDSMFYPPAAELTLFDENSTTIRPEFVKGNYFVAMNMAGDANASGDIELGDCVYIVNYVFKGQRSPNPVESGDANVDAFVNLGDAVHIINYVFKGGPPPGTTTKAARKNPVYYTIEQTSDGNGRSLEIRLDSDYDLGALQFELDDPGHFTSFAEPQTGELAQGVTAYQGYSGRVHRFGLFDMGGVGRINAGQGLVMRIGYSGYDEINMNSFKVFDTDGNEVVAKLGYRENEEALPMQYELSQNYPNPFNPTTTIKYALESDQQVELKVFNVLGQTVATLVSGPQEAGFHSVVWNGTDKDGSQVASGVYFYRLKTDAFTDTRKMTLLK